MKSGLWLRLPTRTITIKDILPPLKKFISTPSVTGSEHDLAAYIERDLSRCGFEVAIVSAAGCGPTIFAQHRFRANGPKLLFFGHLDTVEPTAGWRHPPFRPTSVGSRLYGLGASDMKGGLAALVVAAKKIVHLPLRGSLILALTSDEEMHSKGCDALIQKGKLKGIDAAISAEPTGLDVVEFGRRGRIVYEVNVKGQAGHAAGNSGGINAVEEASKLILGLRKLPLGSRVAKGSVEVLAMSGGTEFLSIPDSCHLLIDRHLAPGESRKAALKQMNRLVKGLKLKAKVAVKLFKKPTPFMEPYLLKENTPIVKVVEEACFKVRGIKPRKRIGLSAGDENYLVTRASIPTVTLGSVGGNEHRPNEWTDIRSVAEATNIYVAVASIFLGSQG